MKEKVILGVTTLLSNLFRKVLFSSEKSRLYRAFNSSMTISGIRIEETFSNLYFTR
jgi:hypothetical protein